MEKMKKKLVINCGTCDATGATEEILAQYDAVKINCGALFANQASMAVLHSHNASINTGSTVTVPDGDVQLKLVNGVAQISGESAPEKPTALMVNGSLIIEKVDPQALENYVLIQVNGKVQHPKSLSGSLHMLQVNGQVEAYPDDAVLLKSRFTVDRFFILRAKGGKYFASGRVLLTDPALDAGKLREKGVLFLTPRAIVAEELLEDAIDLFEEDTEISVVPTGYAFVDDDCTLDDMLIRRCGSKIFVNGDLTVPMQAANALAKLEKLHVNGEVRLNEKLADAFFAIKPEYTDIKLFKGALICDCPEVTVSKDALADGLTIIDCADVVLEEDVSPEEIFEKLKISDCAQVKCTAAQRAAVARVSSDVAQITTEEDEKLAEQQKADENEGWIISKINTASYRF